MNSVPKICPASLSDTIPFTGTFGYAAFGRPDTEGIASVTEMIIVLRSVSSATSLV
jgi:hypothetical protein